MQHTTTKPRKRADNRNLWDRIWKDRRGKVVIYQTPNVLLIVWVVITMISLLLPSKTAENVTYDISLAILAAWALLEITKGANYFRQGLGVLVLLMAAGAAFGIGL